MTKRRGAVGVPAVTSDALTRGDLVRRRAELIDSLYHHNCQMAESLAIQENLVAGLDDDHLSACLWSVQQAVLRFDRELRGRR